MNIKTEDINITLIAAMNYRRVLGDGLTLLWKNNEDLRHFKEQTEGHVVVMGHNTFKSLPFDNGFPNRWNVVVSRRPSFEETPTLRHASGVIEALGIARLMAMELTDKTGHTHKVFCVGGGAVYDAVLRHADRIQLTTIPNDLDGTVLFPRFEHDLQWALEKQEVGQLNSDGSANVYTVWKRNQKTD